MLFVTGLLKRNFGTAQPWSRAESRGAFSCTGSPAGACVRHGAQQAVQLNAPLQGAGKMAEVNIGCVPKLSCINLAGRNLSARPFLYYFLAGLQTVFNGAASLSGVLKTVLLNDSEIQRNPDSHCKTNSHRRARTASPN